MTLEFETIQVVHSLLQSTIGIRKNCNPGVNIYLRSVFYQRYLCQYLTKKIIWKSTSKVHYWPCQILNHILIWHRTLVWSLGIKIHTIQRKHGFIEKDIPIILLVVRVWQGEYITHPIYDHVLMALILVVFDGDLQISSSNNPNKFNRSWILGACILSFLFSLRAC